MPLNPLSTREYLDVQHYETVKTEWYCIFALRSKVAKQIIYNEVIYRMAINKPHVDLCLPASCASTKNDSRNASRTSPVHLLTSSGLCFNIHFKSKLLLGGILQPIAQNEQLY